MKANELGCYTRLKRRCNAVTPKFLYFSHRLIYNLAEPKEDTMQTVTFGQSTFECSEICINTPTRITPPDAIVTADHHFAIYADGQHVGDLHDATLEGNTLRGLFVHA